MNAALARAGFDPARLRFALQTALAAVIALLAAWALGLDHPQWSAMTVWASAQPVRGMLLEKGLFRAAGTAVGVAAGVLLVLATHGEPALLVAGLALWIGICAGLGNVLRGFSSYGCILAGFSAAMVALLDTPHPDHILALGLDRFLTVITGVAVAMLVGLVLTPAAAEDAVAGRARDRAARGLRMRAARLRGAAGDADGALLSDLGLLDEQLDVHGAGSLRRRRAGRALRRLAVALVGLVLWRGQRIDHAAAARIDAAADALAAGLPLADAAALLPALDEVAAVAGALRGAGDARLDDRHGLPAMVLHRDWIGARQAAMRAVVTMLAVGALWLGTGWPGGAYMLLGTSVMITLFSTFDNPAGVMRFVTLGQAAGVAAALACRWLVWPQAQGGFDLVLLMLPFILLASLAAAHRRTMAGGVDVSMAMLLLLQPSWPLAGTLPASVMAAAAVVTGPLVAWAAFRLVWPADARRRRDMLITMMVHELQAMAARPDARRCGPVWRARLQHRLLRLVRWTEKAGPGGPAAIDGGLAVLRLGHAILEMQSRPGSPRTLAVLRRLRRLARDPERAGRALDLLARRQDMPAAGRAASALAANQDFFRRAA